MSDIYELFRGKIAEQKKIRRLTDADIAKMTGYTTSTIRAFMCGVRENEKIANAIARWGVRGEEGRLDGLKNERNSSEE